MFRSLWAGLDPDGFFRRQAGRRGPFTVAFPGLGPVHFFATAHAARDILSAPAAVLEAPTPNPIEPIVGKGSVILVSGEDHRPIVIRRLTAPLTVGGIRWEPGEVVGIAVPALHFDPKRWPHPHRFDPDRFLVEVPTPYEYLPFGGGFRRCPGAAFATYELAISVGTLLKSVELRMPPRVRRRRPPRSVPRGIAVVPRREVRLDVIGRL